MEFIRDMSSEEAQKKLQDYLEGKTDTFPYLDEEEKELIESIENDPNPPQSVSPERKKEIEAIIDKFNRSELKEEIKIHIRKNDMQKLQAQAQLKGINQNELLSNIIHSYFNNQTEVKV